MRFCYKQRDRQLEPFQAGYWPKMPDPRGANMPRTESDEDQTNQKKDMIVRWLNSEALNSCPRPFPQL